MLNKSLLVLSTACLLSASTTMCYKKNHVDPSTISSTNLEGGKCEGKYSVEDMKQKGYIVDSMKLQNATTGLSYVYIFKKENNNKIDNVTSSIISNEQLSARLEKIQEKNKQEEKKKEIVSSEEDGKRIYINHCIQCHGIKGEKEAYNTSRPLNELSFEDMHNSIEDYRYGDKDNGMGVLMSTYSDWLTKTDVKKIYLYLETLK